MIFIRAHAGPKALKFLRRLQTATCKNLYGGIAPAKSKNSLYGKADFKLFIINFF